MMTGIGLFFAALFSAFFGWSVWESNRRDLGESEGTRYSSFSGTANLMAVLMGLVILSCFFYSFTESLSLIASYFLGVFLHICVYNALMLVLVPFLRTKISARACGYLWMIPNILYLTQTDFMSADHPLWVIPVPNHLVKLLSVLWFSGFAVILFYQILTHLIFRRRILRDALPVSDPEILQLWKDEQTHAGIEKPDYQLVLSPAVATPLSIGLWKRSIRVVLPHTSYTPEELQLIFRHELIHICRADAMAKCSLMFWTAICWFNPLMWVSMRKSFDDLELSCDETVLLHATDSQRRLYAQQLLKTAGQEQGYTTCLSASASALRYRMKNSVKPRKLPSGALTVGLVSFLLLTTCGSVALAYDTDTGADAIFFGQNPQDCTLTSIRDNDFSSYREYICRDPDQLREYLSELPVQKLTGNYEFRDSDHSRILLFDTPSGTLGVDLEDTTVHITKFWGEEITQERFYVPGGVDWALLDTVVPQMPALRIRFSGSGGSFSTYASIDTVTQICDGQSEVITGPQSPDFFNGIEGSTLYDTLSLEFPQPPLSAVRVKVSSWDRSHTETFTLDTPDQQISLPGSSAHFTVCASFAGPNSSVYEAVFRFDREKILDETA